MEILMVVFIFDILQNLTHFGEPWKVKSSQNTLLVFKFAQYLNSRRDVVRVIKTERNIIRVSSLRTLKLGNLKQYRVW